MDIKQILSEATNGALNEEVLSEIENVFEQKVPLDIILVLFKSLLVINQRKFITSQKRTQNFLNVALNLSNVSQTDFIVRNLTLVHRS